MCTKGVHALYKLIYNACIYMHTNVYTCRYVCIYIFYGFLKFPDSDVLFGSSKIKMNEHV